MILQFLQSPLSSVVSYFHVPNKHLTAVSCKEQKTLVRNEQFFVPIYKTEDTMVKTAV